MQEKTLSKDLLLVRNTPPESKEDLKYYLRKFYGVFLPATVIDPGNSSPLDFVWDVYSTFMGFSKDPHYNILGMAARGSMKCVEKGTKVYTKRGVLNIEDLVIGDKIFSYPNWASVSNVQSNGIRELWSLETHNGYKFNGTPNHRVAVLDKSTYIRLGKLQHEYKELQYITDEDYILVVKEPIFEFLKNNKDSICCEDDFYFDKVREVKDLHKTNEVFDITVPIQENFVANGIVVHNSLSCGVLEMLAIQFDPFRNWIHMAAIREQADVTYNYVTDIAARTDMKGIVDEPTRDETKNTKTGRTLKICTATKESVNSKHGCFHADTLISLTDGTKKTIKEIVDNKLEVEVWGVNKRGKVVPTKITNWFNNGRTNDWKMVYVTKESGLTKCPNVICTSNHKFFTTDKGYVEAKDLYIGQCVKFRSLTKSKLELDSIQFVASVKILDNVFYDRYDIETETHNYYANGILVHNSLIQDELDLTPKAIYDESKGMLSAECGKMPLNVAISSRKYGMGNVQQILDKVNSDPTYPFIVHKWGLLEITAKCHPSRHGAYGTEILVDEDNLIALSRSEFEQLPLDAPTRKNYVSTVGYENCLSCGIFSFCKGRLPNQEEDNPYLQPIEYTKNIFKTDDLDFFKAQRLNRKPSKKGLIYPMFEEYIHVKTYAQMWEIFHGEPHPDTVPDPKTGQRKRAEITLEELAKAFIKTGCACYTAVDFGFSILAVCGLYFIDGSGRIYFVSELSFTGYSEPEIALELQKEWGKYPVSICYADPESPSGKKEIRKATNWIVSEDVDKKVENGLGTVRKFMRVPGTQRTNLYVSVNCTVFREEVKGYHYKIDPRTNEPLEVVEKKKDHSMDQCRYFLHTLFGGNEWNFDMFDQQRRALKEIDLKYPTRAPTAVELGTKLGIFVNDNRHEFDEYGNRIEKKLSEGSAFNYTF